MRVGFSWATFYHTSESNVCCCRYYSCSNWKAPWHPSEFVKNCWHVFYRAHPQPNGEVREGGRDSREGRQIWEEERVKEEEEKGGRRIRERICFHSFLVVSIFHTHTLHTHTHTPHTHHTHTHTINTHTNTQQIHTHTHAPVSYRWQGTVPLEHLLHPVWSGPLHFDYLGQAWASPT